MDPENIDWKSDSEKELDLELENEALELDLKLNSGEFFKNEDTPAELYNQFLHSIKEYESQFEQARGTILPVHSLFPENFKFPPADELTDLQICEKIKDITRIFKDNNIQLALSDHLPEKLLYQYIREHVLDEIPPFPYGTNCRSTYVIDGCGGYCPECFQRDYCQSAADWD